MPVYEKYVSRSRNLKCFFLNLWLLAIKNFIYWNIVQVTGQPGIFVFFKNTLYSLRYHFLYWKLILFPTRFIFQLPSFFRPLIWFLFVCRSNKLWTTSWRSCLILSTCTSCSPRLRRRRPTLSSVCRSASAWTCSLTWSGMSTNTHYSSLEIFKHKIPCKRWKMISFAADLFWNHGKCV